MSKKYELTNQTKQIKDRLTKQITNLYRIRALKDFDDVKAGDLGGYIENESNLSHYGNCWVYDEALVYGYAHVSDHAKVRHLSHVRGRVYGNAEVYGNAKISGYVKVWGRAYGRAKIDTQSKIKLVPDNYEVYKSDEVVKIEK
ncbi:hypothetical protein [Bartonella sp. B1099]|uniref:hypothetical protein n=1 Tax=Bartonella sp. B1099 TaxID=2911422 RepID=UPI0020C4348B|nr:hypothetical protein [Bartonella sp. B1099]